MEAIKRMLKKLLSLKKHTTIENRYRDVHGWYWIRLERSFLTNSKFRVGDSKNLNRFHNPTQPFISEF